MASADRGQEERGEAGGALVKPGAYESESAARIAEIRANIERARRQISEGFTDIQTDVEDRLDWKGWVEDNPWKTVGIAFGVGFMLGLR
jgi:ElaB/YqjD/DUF883 family membrane-anchored ribosome-binding protein